MANAPSQAETSAGLERPQERVLAVGATCLIHEAVNPLAMAPASNKGFRNGFLTNLTCKTLTRAPAGRHWKRWSVSESWAGAAKHSGGVT